MSDVIRSLLRRLGYVPAEEVRDALRLHESAERSAEHLRNQLANAERDIAERSKFIGDHLAPLLACSDRPEYRMHRYVDTTSPIETIHGAARDLLVSIRVPAIVDCWWQLPDNRAVEQFATYAAEAAAAKIKSELMTRIGGAR